MIRKLLALTVLALSMLGVAGSPAMAASACLTSTVTINGTDLPTNGTNCVEPPA